MNMHALCIRAGALVVLCSVFTLQAADPDNSLRLSGEDVIDLGTLGGSSSLARDINNDTTIVGRSMLPGDTQINAFIIHGGEGAMVDLGTLPDSPGSAARAISDSGVVVGWSWTPFGIRHAVFFGEGSVIDIQGIGQGEAGLALQQAFISSANDVANDGTTVGRKEHVSVDGPNAFVFEEQVLNDLPTFGGPKSTARGVNDHGIICGCAALADVQRGHVALWIQGKLIDLGTLGGRIGCAQAVNNLDEVVGNSWTRGNQERHAFLWTADLGMMDLGTLGAGTHSTANDINENSVIVGFSSTLNADFRHAFLIGSDGIMVDIHPLGWMESVAFAINDHDQVVGAGLLPNGNWHALLWNHTTK